MLNTCYEIAANLKLVFNCNKSKCITFGPGCKLDISDMYLGASTMKWCHTIKYLGVTLLSGPHMKVDIDVIKESFLQVVSK